MLQKNITVEFHIAGDISDTGRDQQQPHNVTLKGAATTADTNSELAQKR